MQLHQALAKYLVDDGYDTLFGLIGDANLFFAESYSREFGGRYVSFSHESGAVLAALGYSKVTGKTGLATVTHGPGFSNTVTALIEGVRSATPCVLVAGSTDPNDLGHLQRLEQRELTASTGAGFVDVRSPETWFDDVRAALRRARTEWRPIVLNVAADLMLAEVADWQYSPLVMPSTLLAPAPSEVEAAVGALSVARRPIVLAGRGAGDPDARAAILQLAERLGAPVATSLGGKGLFHDEPYNLGIVGTLASETTMHALAASDCIISFGASLNRFTSARGTLLAGKTVIANDRDARRIHVDAPSTFTLTGDAGLAAAALTEAVDTLELKPTSFRESLEYEPVPLAPRGELLDIRGVLDVLDGGLPENRILVTDAGRTITHSWQRMGVTHPRRAVHTANFGSIGLSVAHAIGAAVADPDALVVTIVGDGGFMLGGLAEFTTAVRHDLRMLVVVLNDASYGAEYIQFEKRDMNPEISVFAWPDLGGVATALGGIGHTVRDWDALHRRVEEARTANRPMLLNIELDARTVPSLR